MCGRCHDVIKTCVRDSRGDRVLMRPILSHYPDDGSIAVLLWPANAHGQLVSETEFCCATAYGIASSPHGGKVALDVGAMGAGLSRDVVKAGLFHDTGGRVRAPKGPDYVIATIDQPWLDRMPDEDDPDAMSEIWFLDYMRSPDYTIVRR